MCLAIAKPKGIVVPKEYMQRAFSTNRDGAGFAYHQKGRVHILKGFMTFDDFWAAWEPHQNKQALIHFRFTTHGSTNWDNCHPFELSDGALIHNGIIPSLGDDMSDYRAWWSRKESKIKSETKGKTYQQKFDYLRKLVINTMGFEGPRAIKQAGDWIRRELKDQNKKTKEEAMNAVLEEFEWVVDDQPPPSTRSDTREFVEDWLKGFDEHMMIACRKFIEDKIGHGSKVATIHNSGRMIIFNERMGTWDNGVWYSNSCYKPYTSTYSGAYNYSGNSGYSGPSKSYSMVDGKLTEVGKELAPAKSDLIVDDEEEDIPTEEKDINTLFQEFLEEKNLSREDFLDNGIDSIHEMVEGGFRDPWEPARKAGWMGFSDD